MNKIELKKELKNMGIRVVGNHVRKSDIEKIVSALDSSKIIDEFIHYMGSIRLGLSDSEFNAIEKWTKNQSNEEGKKAIKKVKQKIIKDGSLKLGIENEQYDAIEKAITDVLKEKWN